ncbi:hypothetical protein [Duganella sp. HH105]|uniref:hypothetical protein n=1 Tax=Duganella sp. HH105 TaxID=1781067 RepID=UPI000877C35E|nr:hypothetical protein [Duganella sp. HH105]OEZ59060.1 hypothetical protein DUGA6_36410 [Duganella sp. HH105]
MSVKFERISLFLNMISKKLCVGGSQDIALSWIDDKVKIQAKGICENSETQVLVANEGYTMFWIANNEEEASIAQKAYLDKLGISTFLQLSAHVDTYEEALRTAIGRPAASASGSKVVMFGNMIDEEKLFKPAPTPTEPLWMKNLAWASIEVKIPKAITHSNTTSKNIQPALGMAPDPFTLQSFAFINDDYDHTSDTQPTRHAEQKLLAAFSKLQKNIIRGMQISIHGCKAACSCCAEVLVTARKSLLQNECTLKVDNSFAENPRRAAGFSPKVVGKTIAKLDPKYYPVPPEPPKE